MGRTPSKQRSSPTLIINVKLSLRVFLELLDVYFHKVDDTRRSVLRTDITLSELDKYFKRAHTHTGGDKKTRTRH